MIDGEGDTQGWNRFSYVKGNPVVYKDPTGHNTVVLQSKKGAGVPGTDLAAGHSAGLVETKNSKGDTEWIYVSKNGENVKGSKNLGSNSKLPKFKNPEEFFKKQAESVETLNKIRQGGPDAYIGKQELVSKLEEYARFDEKTNQYEARYEEGLEIKTKKDGSQDKAFYKHAKENQDKQYWLVSPMRRNCKDLISDSLNVADITNNTTPTELPNNWYDRLKDSMKEQKLIKKVHKAKDYDKRVYDGEIFNQ